VPPLSVHSGGFNERLHDLGGGLVAMPTEVRSHEELLLGLGQMDQSGRVEEAGRLAEG
jgi:hypothetical protein